MILVIGINTGQAIFKHCSRKEQIKDILSANIGMLLKKRQHAIENICAG